MKLFKQFIISVLIAAAGFSVCGCRVFGFQGKDLKDVVLDAMDGAMQGFSKGVLTRKFRLVGDKAEGDTAYEGEYSASYKDFSGKEILFGSTALNLNNDINMLVKYELTSDSGKGYLYRVTPDGISIVIQNGSGEAQFDLEPGDNYIIFQGDHFTGDLTLECAVADE